MIPGTQVLVDGVTKGDRVFNGMTGVVLEVDLKPHGYTRIKPTCDYSRWRNQMVGHTVVLHPESLKEVPSA